MPTQEFSRAAIRERWGLITGFLPAPADNEISAGLPAGRVTDDTDQAVIVGRLLVAGGGRVDPYDFADELGAWEARMRAAGSLDLLGPSTSRALAALAAGAAPDETGRAGTTNGAAMRIAPVGVATPAEPLAALVDAVADASRVTHDTGAAIAGAAAVAAAVSAGVAGGGVAEAVALAVAAARIGATRGHPAPEAVSEPGPDVAECIEAALGVVTGMPTGTSVERAALVDAVSERVGTRLVTYESVPAALAIAAAAAADPWLACCLAASVGGDSDTIACMTGAILGAVHGASAFPAPAVATVIDANPGLGLEVLAAELLALRLRSDGTVN